MSIKSLIKQSGPISISDFMQHAMFNKKDGYYRTKKPIGADSDFVTAPEISSLFGELIAAYFLNFILNSKQKITFVEMGAGLGTLYHDILTTFTKIATKLNKLQQIQQQLNFSIIEISEELTKIQQKKLENSNFNIKWHKNFENFTENNQNRQIYFIANELFDCFPTHQFSKSCNKWQEVLIGLKNDNLTLTLEEFNQEKHNFINKIALENKIPSQNNIIFEHSFQALNFMQQLSQALSKQGGVGITFDYGYLRPPLKSTLQAIKSHQKQDFLQNIGSSDLTTLVNFTALEEAARNSNLQTSLITQKQFLQELGIENRTKDASRQVKQAVNRLIDEKEMGELFKCLIFWKNPL